MPTFNVPAKPLARLRNAHAQFAAAKAHFEELANAVAEALGVDTDAPGVNVDLDAGVITHPEVPASGAPTDSNQPQ